MWTLIAAWSACATGGEHPKTIILEPTEPAAQPAGASLPAPPPGLAARVTLALVQDGRGLEVRGAAGPAPHIIPFEAPVTSASWGFERARDVASASEWRVLKGLLNDDEAMAHALTLSFGGTDTQTVLVVERPGNTFVARLGGPIDMIELPLAEKPPPPARKPVIYLYPERPMAVTVSVELAGDWLAAYPAPADGAWNVWASPNGVLRTPDGRRHRYLFWEGSGPDFRVDRAEAHLVAKAEAVPFLEGVCDAYALTDFECGDFVTYWLPELSSHPFTLVSFPAEAYARFATLRVSPEPHTVIRLFMLLEPSEKAVAVGAPPLPRRHREGFTVVEWGGAVANP